MEQQQQVSIGIVQSMTSVSYTHLNTFPTAFISSSTTKAGVLIADYWFLGRGKKENWSIIPGLNWYGIAAWIAGTVIALYASFFSQALDSIIVSFVVYSVLNLLFGKKELQHKNSEAIEN